MLAGPASRAGHAEPAPRGHNDPVTTPAGSASTPLKGPLGPGHRGVTLRRGEIVSPLELFFDLVFVLAITQCTALMATDPTWAGIGRGLVVLGLLWWSWVGYAWLTSVMDPDEGPVRFVLFAAMAALLVTSLCVPEIGRASCREGVLIA